MATTLALGDDTMASADELHRLYGAGEYVRAWVEYQGLVASGMATAEAHLWGGLAAWRQRDSERALVVLSKGLSERSDEVLRLKILLAHACALRENGNAEGAAGELEEYTLLSAGHTELASFRGYGWYNLGLARWQNGDYEGALSAYAHAIEWCRREHQPVLERLTLQNQAWTYCATGRAEEATALLDAAEDLCDSVEAKRQQTLGYAYIAYLRDEHDRTRELAGEILQAQEESGGIPALVLSQSYQLSAWAHLGQGNLHQAEASAQLALDTAMAAHEPHAVRDASGLLKRVRERMSQSA